LHTCAKKRILRRPVDAAAIRRHGQRLWFYHGDHLEGCWVHHVPWANGLKKITTCFVNFN